MLKKALDVVQSHISKHPEKEAYVIKLPSDVTPKAVADTIKAISASKDAKLKSKSIYLLGADAAEGKVNHGCYIASVSSQHITTRLTTQDAIAKGAVGAEWSGSVASKVGGKTGGKGATSTGVGNKLDEVDAGIAAAIEYLDKLKISSHTDS
jgi:alanyl-tRNA synthetase